MGDTGSLLRYEWWCLAGERERASGECCLVLRRAGEALRLSWTSPSLSEAGLSLPLRGGDRDRDWLRLRLWLLDEDTVDTESTDGERGRLDVAARSRSRLASYSAAICLRVISSALRRSSWRL